MANDTAIQSTSPGSPAVERRSKIFGNIFSTHPKLIYSKLRQTVFISNNIFPEVSVVFSASHLET